MKKNLVIKVTLLITVALLIFAVIIGVVIADNNKRLMSNELIRLTNVYAEYAAVEGIDSVIALSNKDTDVRITVIDLQGKVIADSLASPAEMDNHLDRTEIQQAINATKNKVVIRYSSTAKEDLMYYAVKVDIEGQSVLIRSSMPSVNMTTYLVTSFIIIAVLTLSIIGISTVIANNLAKSSLSPLEKVQNGLIAIKNGTFTSVMPHEKHQEINVLLSNINDVAEYINKTLKDLNSEKQKLQYLTENMAQAVIATDNNNFVIMANSRAITLFGTLQSRPIDLALCDKDLISVYGESAINNVTTTTFMRDKKYYRYSVCTTPYDKQIINKIVLITDITKIKLAELERREFFANCSHELKTPLTVIKGYSELMSNGMVSGEKFMKYSNNITADAEKLLGIIDDMLTLSRLDETLNGEPQLVSLQDTVKTIVAELNQVNDNNITCTVNNDDATVNMNPKNLRGLLRNVIENAYKYNVQDGTVNINIANTNNQIILTVKDSGEGIPKECLSRVTERFYRVERSRTVKSGSGLGLAIVKHICELSNIKLKIDSKINVGTTITLTFNRVQ